MGPIPRSEFVRLVRGLSTESFVEFVADVWRARGRSVIRRHGALYATDPATDETERLRVSAAGGPEDQVGTGESSPDVDRVVTVSVRRDRPAAASDEPTVDVDDLYRLLKYALASTAADRLARKYFDRPFYRTAPPTATDVESSEQTAEVGSSAARLRRAFDSTDTSRGLVLAGVLILLLAGVLGATAMQITPTDSPGDADPEAADRDPGSRTTGTPTAIQEDSRETPPHRTHRGLADVGDEHQHEEEAMVQAEALPPGLGPSGIEDADRLAAAHATALQNRSYRVVFTHREFVFGRSVGLAREVVTVASSTVYRSRVDRVGSLRTDPLIVADRSAYADGEFRYERIVRENRTGYLRESPTPWRDGLHGRDRYLGRTSTYVRWFLSVEESRIAGTTERDGVRYYWVVTEGEPFPGYPNARGSALIDENGVVHEVRRTYDDPEPRSGEIEIAFRYTQFGNVTVTPPTWAAEARTAVGPQQATATPTPSVHGDSTTNLTESPTFTTTTDSPNGSG